MGPIASGGSVIFLELPSDSSIEQTNNELKGVEVDLEALQEMQGDLTDTILRDGEQLNDVEKRTQRASEAITQGAARLSESQRTKSTMNRLGLCVGIGTAGGLIVGACAVMVLPPVAGIVALFVTTLGGMASGGAISLKI